MDRPSGQDAIDFLGEWDNASRDIIAKTKLCIKYHGSDRLLRGWAEYIRKDIALKTARPVSELKKHNNQFRNQFVKRSSNPTVFTLNTGNRHTSLLSLNDLHKPFSDEVTEDLIVRFIKDIQPDYIDENGDWIDFYQISRFDRNPKRAGQLQDDIDSGKKLDGRIREAAPNAKIIRHGGNHEDRLRRYLWSKAPELESLDCLDIVELLGLSEAEIDYIPYGSTLRVNEVLRIEHGDVISKHSGWTAKAMYERRGGCGICGHSHRMGSYYKVHDGDTLGWWENGCLCDLTPEYVQEPNWMQGFSLIHFIGKRFYVEQIPIIRHKFVYGGKLFE